MVEYMEKCGTAMQSVAEPWQSMVESQERVFESYSTIVAEPWLSMVTHAECSRVTTEYGKPGLHIELSCCVFVLRLAFERSLDLDPRCVGALVGLALLELNSKQVNNCTKISSMNLHLTNLHIDSIAISCNTNLVARSPPSFSLVAVCEST